MSGAAGGSHAGKSHGGKSHVGKSEHHSKHGSEHKSEHLSVHESHHSTHRSRSRGRSPHGSSHTTIKISKSRERSHSPDEKELVIERKPSKHRRRRKSHAGHTKTEDSEEEEVGESNAIKTGPLALVLPSRSKRRRGSDRRVRDEIRELEIEKERLRKERRRGEKKYHHHHHRPSSSSSSSSSDTEVIIERKGSHAGRVEDVKIEKDKKGNMKFIR